MQVHFYKKGIACLTPELKKFDCNPFRDCVKKLAEDNANRLFGEYSVIRGVVSCGEEKAAVAIYCRRFTPADTVFYASQTVYGSVDDVTSFVRDYPTSEGWSCVGGKVVIVDIVPHLDHVSSDN
jgi:hypothetical protein